MSDEKQDYESMHAELTARRARDAEAVRRQDMTTNDKLADALRNLIRAGKHLRNTVVETRGVAGMDDHDVAISDSIAALAEHDAQPAPAPVQVEGWWRVEVSDSAGQIVAIEPGMLAGRDVGCGSDDATIRLVVEHLRSFIGEPAHPPAPAADGAGELPRYGIRWNGPTQPISVPIGDGYWTPWHLAHAAIAALQAQQPGAQAVDLYTVDDSAQACSDGCCGGCQFRPYIPHPPSIPEPSEEDVDVACEALDFDNDVFAHMRERVQGVLATYTARLRERIGGGA